MNDCIFCKIASGQIPATKLYESDNVIAFNDVNPEAPTHILVIPKKHIVSFSELDFAGEDSAIFIEMMRAIQHLTMTLGDGCLEKNGYRVVNNKGQDGGQTVSHIHFHILGGRSLGWPPG